MIEALGTLDERTALGVLARCALALEDEGNPDAQTIFNEETTLRATILREARQRLGIAQDDSSPETLEKISDFLDQESDRLAGIPDTDAALKRLAERGELPTDLYEIHIIPNIAEFHGTGFALEQSLIEMTIRAPTKEQHFGPESYTEQPALISLFARQFKTRFPYKNFTMLVAGKRNGLRLLVYQAWRIYPAILDGLDIGRVDTLVDLLRKFAEAYGWKVEIDGKSGPFFFFLDRAAPPEITVELSPGRRKIITVSQFMEENRQTGRPSAALVVAIDFTQYRDMLRRMDVPMNDILL
jgi:hypothetical protein